MSRVWRLLPPRKSLVALSSTSTRAPARRAVMAAHSPALPPPTTSTSKGRVRSAIKDLCSPVWLAPRLTAPLHRFVDVTTLLHPLDKRTIDQIRRLQLGQSWIDSQ